MNLYGTYVGTVENVRDPEKLGRIKVRVPHVYGAASTGAGYIGADDLPWALPAGMPAGGSAASGGFSHIPGVGDHVLVRFLDGEPEKPVWEWGCQTFEDRERFSLHAYDTGTDGSVGLPKATRWLRYGHAMEITQTGMTMSSSNGYRVQIVDGQPADGEITVTTKLGNFIKWSDADDGITVYTNQDLTIQNLGSLYGTSNDFSWQTTAGGATFDSGDDFALTALTSVSVDAGTALTLNAADTAELTAAHVALGGSEAAEPLMLGIQTTLWLNSLLVYLSTHTHSNGNEGSPTGPPIISPYATLSDIESLVSTVVFTT